MKITMMSHAEIRSFVPAASPLRGERRSLLFHACRREKTRVRPLLHQPRPMTVTSSRLNNHCHEPFMQGKSHIGLGYSLLSSPGSIHGYVPSQITRLGHFDNSAVGPATYKADESARSRFRFNISESSRVFKRKKIGFPRIVRSMDLGHCS